jgi:hypothetical protein
MKISTYVQCVATANQLFGDPFHAVQSAGGAASAAYLGSWTSAAWGANATGVTDTEIKIAGLRLRRVRPGSERWHWPMD